MRTRTRTVPWATNAFPPQTHTRRTFSSVFETYASAFMRSACRKRSAVISTITLGFRIKSKPKKKTPISKRTIHRGKRVYSRDGHYFRVYPVVARTAETSRPDHRFRRSCRSPSTVANDFYAVTEEKSKLFAERAEFPGPTGKTSRTRSARVVRSSKIYRKSLGGGGRERHAKVAGSFDSSTALGVRVDWRANSRAATPLRTLVDLRGPNEPELIFKTIPSAKNVTA